MQRFCVVILIVITLACGIVPERVSFDDPRVKELITAMSSVDRRALGFSSIDPTADLRLEWRPRAGYDAMLHVYGKTRRTVAFRRGASAYEWIGEQETFEGPAEYVSPDGRFHEAITITFEKVPLSGAPLDKVYIRYDGEDQRLLDLDDRGQLSLHDVTPVLVKWGYGE